MKHLWLIALFSMLAAPLSAQTKEFTDTSGNAFVRLSSAIDKENETQAEQVQVMGCVGYVDGFTSGVGFEKLFAGDALSRTVPAPFCLPDQVEDGQIIRVVLKYIRDNPASAHLRTGALIISALKQAYPCPSK